ncbi:sex hormone-binding globulin isoform X2 [Mauremys reevesii]|uniref:sex hormone-binding globulin isoform X2 n=1 Tax=Mauremys reevesii TaxID=260615 RepID=UPI00193F7314|nr:sex hormone-binding globulin isoform X2 [Mauremys reevesii]
MGFPAGLLALISVVALLYPPITRGDSAQDGHCFQVLPGEEGALNIGRHWGGATPAATIFIDLSTVTSAASFFDFRTLDPEGVIFFGDMGDQSDWFVLGLRRGRAEMQISSVMTNISVRGGRRLDDGQWHRMMVMNEGDSVRLEVDGDELLTLGHVSYPIIERPASAMRLAVGGLLLPASYLLAPMNTPMDGCLRRWRWLNQSTTWREGAALQAKAKPCFSALLPGSFFPGAGLASFRPADLAGGAAPPNGSWGLEVELGLRAPRQMGLVLAVGAPDGSLALSLVLQPTRGSRPPAPRSGGPSGAACAGSGCKATSWTWTPPCSGATPYGPTAAPAATSGREGGAEPGGDGRHHRWWEGVCGWGG